MATSGWQNEQFIKQCSTNYHYNGNIYVSSITHSGTNLRVTGRVALCSRGTSGYRYNWQNVIYANVANSGNTQIRATGYYYVGTDTYCDFDVTIANVAATTTSYSLAVNFNSYNINVTLYWTLNFDASAVAPSGLTATLDSISDTSAVITASLSSYGTPSSEADRYIEASILGQSTYGGQYRYDYTKAVKTTTLTIDNNSKTNSSNPLTITPNTSYWYGAYATNTSLPASTVVGTFNTLPARITSASVGYDVLDPVFPRYRIVLRHASEGTAETVYRYYKIGDGDWTMGSSVQDILFIAASEITETVTVALQRRNSSDAAANTYYVTITPFTNARLYGSVNGRSKKITKLYGSVNGVSKKITKLYGSVDGVAKLIYKDE